MTLTSQERFWAKVNKTPTCWDWTGSKSRADTDRYTGYGNFWVAGSCKRSHRVAYEWLVGPIPPGMEIDHTCHNTLCVNPGHLRPVTRKQNNENRAGAPSNSSSGVRGVSWESYSRRWKAQISHQNKRINIGRFKTIPEAEIAVVAKRNELFTHNDVDRRVK